MKIVILFRQLLQRILDHLVNTFVGIFAELAQSPVGYDTIQRECFVTHEF